jgi:gliding motility-associated lipoprotein GldD
MSCGTDYVPKPKGYNRILLPPPEYQSLPDTLPYDFEYSKYAKLLKDTSWITEKYWVDLYYPEMGAHVQITYKPINQDSTVDSYLTDSYRLTGKHNVKAYSIDEKVLFLKGGNVASVSELTGDVPSPFQFHITDSTSNFLRGSLYFETAIKNDSLQPTIDYVKNDLVHLLNTVSWKTKN